MYFGQGEISQLDDLLNRICEKIQLSKEMHEVVEKEYDELHKHLEDFSYTLGYDGILYSQGSYALGTTVKPLGSDDFDLDAVLHFEDVWASTLDSQDILDNKLNSCLKIKYKTQLKNRCVRIDLKGFHLDVVPAFSYEKNDSDKIMVPNIETNGWKKSCPKGYIVWFENKCKTSQVLLEKRALFEHSYKITQENLPDELPYEMKPPLKRAVQLMKRYRDVYYKSYPKQSPASIIITTLCGKHYDGSISEFDAIKNILFSIKKEISNNEGILRIVNPANTDEVISESFDEERYSKFICFIDDFISVWASIENARGINAVKDVLNKMFEENVAIEAIREQALFIEKQRNLEKLAIDKTTGIISSVAIQDTQPIKKNTFFGV